jgi:hypothetical protein
VKARRDVRETRDASREGKDKKRDLADGQYPKLQQNQQELSQAKRTFRSGKPSKV